MPNYMIVPPGGPAPFYAHAAKRDHVVEYVKSMMPLKRGWTFGAQVFGREVMIDVFNSKGALQHGHSVTVATVSKVGRGRVVIIDADGKVQRHNGSARPVDPAKRAAVKATVTRTNARMAARKAVDNPQPVKVSLPAGFVPGRGTVANATLVPYTKRWFEDAPQGVKGQQGNGLRVVTARNVLPNDTVINSDYEAMKVTEVRSITAKAPGTDGRPLIVTTIVVQWHGWTLFLAAAAEDRVLIVRPYDKYVRPGSSARKAVQATTNAQQLAAVSKIADAKTARIEARKAKVPQAGNNRPAMVKRQIKVSNLRRGDRLVPAVQHRVDKGDKGLWINKVVDGRRAGTLDVHTGRGLNQETYTYAATDVVAAYRAVNA